MTGRTLQSFKHRIQMLRNFVLNSFTNISYLDCNDRRQTSTFYNISLWYTEWRKKSGTWLSYPYLIIENILKESLNLNFRKPISIEVALIEKQ